MDAISIFEMLSWDLSDGEGRDSADIACPALPCPALASPALPCPCLSRMS